MYRLDPVTREVRVVTDGFDKCNGIAFSPDGTVAYVYVKLPQYASAVSKYQITYSTDTGASTLGPSFNSTEPATM